MRDVIEKVMAAEEEARKILEKAKDDAAAIVSDGRAEATRIEMEGRNSFRAETDAIIGKAVAEAEAKASAALAAAKANIDAEVAVSDERLGEVARAAAEAVVSAAG